MVDIVATSRQTIYAIGFAFVIENGVSRITYHYFFQRSGGRWTVVDSALSRPEVEIPWGFVGLWASPSGTLSSVGNVGVFRWGGARSLTTRDPY